jgi:hypothetical protein
VLQSIPIGDFVNTIKNSKEVPKPQDEQMDGSGFAVLQDFLMNEVLYSLNGNGNMTANDLQEVR